MTQYTDVWSLTEMTKYAGVNATYEPIELFSKSCEYEMIFQIGENVISCSGHVWLKLGKIDILVTKMNPDMRYPTMWYVRPTKPQISLHVPAVWSETLLVAWIFYDC